MPKITITIEMKVDEKTVKHTAERIFSENEMLDTSSKYLFQDLCFNVEREFQKKDLSKKMKEISLQVATLKMVK